MSNARAVFDFWNDMPKHEKWWHHRFMTPDMETAIAKVLKRGYSIAYLCGAIENYYKAVTTKGSWWHDTKRRKWDIETFFKQGEAKKGQCEWKRFEPERFEMSDCYTLEHKKRLANRKTHATPEPVEPASATDYEHLAKDNPDNRFYQEMARKLRKMENVG